MIDPCEPFAETTVENARRRTAEQGLSKVNPSFPRKRESRTFLFAEVSGFLLSQE